MLAELLGLLVPPRCALCGAGCASRAQLCEGCESRLGGLRPCPAAVPATDGAWCAAPYEGVARELVVALKFGARLGLAHPAAAAIAAGAPDGLLCGEIVPVPPAPWRRRRRGFDAAEALARALAAEAGLPVRPCLRRSQGRRQVGRPRAQRLADPPRIRVAAAPPVRAVLVDDVLTTGATLAACARALRAHGTIRVAALAFARTGGGTRITGPSWRAAGAGVA
jgi:predicted amidophosphoribosyltransferase